MSFHNQSASKKNKSSHSRRANAELQLSIAFGLLAVVTLSFGEYFNLTWLKLLSPIFVYASALWLSGVFTLGVIIFYSLLSFVFPESTLHLIRVDFFAVLLMISALSLYRIPAFLLVSTAWIILLIGLNSELSIASQILSSEPLYPALNALMEVSAILLLGIYSYSRGLGWALNRKRQIYTLTGLYCHVPVAAALLFYMTFRAAHSYINNFKISPTISAQAPAIQTSEAIVVLACLWIPMIAGFLLSLISLHFVKFIVELLQSRSLARFGNDTRSALLEFTQGLDLLQSYLESSAQTVRVAEKTNKELSSQFNQKISDIKNLQAQINADRKLLDSSPWGIISVTANGIIREVNSTVSKLIGNDYNNLIGKHFRTINPTGTWSKEIHTLISLACSKYKDITQPQLKHRSSTINDLALEIIICPSTLSEKTDASEAVNVLPSEAVITLFMRETIDLGEQALELLSPTPHDAAAYRAIEFCKEANNQLSVALQALTRLRTFVSNHRQVFESLKEQNEQVVDFLHNSENLDRTLHSLFTASGNLNVNVLAMNAQDGEINLSKSLQGGTSLLNELLCIDDPILLQKTSACSSDLNGTVIGDVLKSQDLPEITITANPHNAMQWCNFYTALLATLSSKASNIKTTIGYETIGSSTANLIPGSTSGKFARIVITHPGQSLMSAVRTDNLIERVTGDNLKPDPDTILAFLMLQTKRLGGFMSAQSNSTKGTSISIYLPVKPRTNQNQIETLAKKNRKQKTAESLISDSKNALIVSSSTAVTDPLTNTLKELGYDIKISAPQILLADFESPTELQGLGFEEKTTNNNSSSDETRTTNDELETLAKNFDLVVVDVEFANSATMYLITELQKLHPNAATFLVTSSDSQETNLFSEWLTLNKPLDTTAVKDCLQKILKSSAINSLEFDSTEC